MVRGMQGRAGSRRKVLAPRGLRTEAVVGGLANADDVPGLLVQDQACSRADTWASCMSAA